MLNWVLLMFRGTKSNPRSWKVSVKEECWTVTHLTQVKQCLTSFTVDSYVTNQCKFLLCTGKNFGVILKL